MSHLKKAVELTSVGTQKAHDTRTHDDIFVVRIPPASNYISNKVSVLLRQTARQTAHYYCDKIDNKIKTRWTTDAGRKAEQTVTKGLFVDCTAATGQKIACLIKKSSFHASNTVLTMLGQA
eukprot:1157642-Pelagomonas_calceolata.AAC.2